MDDVAVRIGDSERWAVDARLQQAVGDGQLTLAEYEERAGEVWRARTRPELDATTRDLPLSAPAPVPAPVAGARARARRVFAVMSGDELSGPVAPGQDVEAYAVMGGATLDLRRDDLPAEVHVRAVAVMGGIEVLVPRGVAVHLSGLSLMGGRELHVDTPRPGAPVVQVQAYALMGGIEVKHGKEPAPVTSGSGSVRLTKERPVVATREAHRHRRSHRGRLVAGVVLVAALVGVPAVVRADDAAVFSSSVVHLEQGQSIDVAALFGSVTVVVPDTARIDSHGAMIFGSNDCQNCAINDSDVTGTVDVHGRGAFGSVEIVREKDYRADRS